eukprot:TRINITY_DN4932_c0_g1_i1.p2 TRINITY_DN4932_c0_g1~~TRINITY_DN4932_c0_g1_i1.p2  ORF type:complete len:301 (+),score=37.77 TRINITY_DN4932_c0_g1_i1:89-904(+)
MKGQEVSNLMWALQQLRYYDEEMILLIEDNIMNNKDIDFNSQEISNIMLAFADLGLYNKQKILEIMVKKFISNKFFKSQDWRNFLYALAVLDCPLNLSRKVVNKLFAQQDQNNISENFREIQLRQIQLAQIFYNIRGQKLDFPADLEQKSKKELQTYQKERMLLQNSFLDVVFPIIKSHFDFAEERVLICDDQIQINIALQKVGENSKVAIVTNTHQSYFVNIPEKVLGRIQHHIFLLEKLGWQVVEVGVFKWNNELYQQQIINEIKAKFK